MIYVRRSQIVGWPPVRSFRKNVVQPKKTEAETGNFVKVSMDGAPYLRKIDLKIYKGYQELLKALENMFKLTIGKILFESMDGAPYSPFVISLVVLMNVWFCCTSTGEYSEREGYKGSEYAPAYEDKDGDLMLVGDVPWE